MCSFSVLILVDQSIKDVNDEIMLVFEFCCFTHSFYEQQTISSGLITGNAKRPQDTKEARAMALLSYREVLALPVLLRYKSCPRYRTGTRLTHSRSTSLNLRDFTIL